jgi:hypothetical protein
VRNIERSRSLVEGHTAWLLHVARSCGRICTWGPGPLTTFHEADRLAGLFDHWRETEPDMELVLASDVFDFLQVAGYDGFSTAKAAARFDEIARNTATATVLAALHRLAGHAGVWFS